MGATARPAYKSPEGYTGLTSSVDGRVASNVDTIEVPLTQSLREDIRLLNGVRRGDKSALEEIVHGHRGAIYGYLRARLFEPADADDLCQEVFLRCYCGRVKFDRATQLRPWLIGIARNVLREHVRKQTRSKQVAWTELCLELDALAESERPNQPNASEHLPECLVALGKSAREALDMHYGANLKLAEIGQRLHRSEGAVKLLVFRARQALRKCLDSRMRLGEQ